MPDDPAAPLREPPVRAVETTDGAAVLTLAGELDLFNAEEVRRGLADAIATGSGRIVVDLAEVEFIDSTALGTLVEARSALGDRELLLAAPQPEPRRALRVSGLDRHLAVHDSVAAALAS
ncbi:MAG: STAS domain-containing protein [Actinobacteria bacterium]|nr:STAS domain-containing protein [Actinomycetota bacterium]